MNFDCIFPPLLFPYVGFNTLYNRKKAGKKMLLECPFVSTVLYEHHNFFSLALICFVILMRIYMIFWRNFSLNCFSRLHGSVFLIPMVIPAFVVMWNALREPDCLSRGGQCEGVGTWAVSCRVVAGKAPVDCVFELLSLGCCTSCGFGVSNALVLI